MDYLVSESVPPFEPVLATAPVPATEPVPVTELVLVFEKSLVNEAPLGSDYLWDHFSARGPQMLSSAPVIETAASVPVHSESLTL